MIEIPDILIENLAASENVAALTGAGVSAESGIATFRDPDGLWTKFNPMELASIDGFMSNSNLVWEWYQYRRRAIHDTDPNPGHYAIAEMETMFPVFTLITQNVDRLHQRAGSKNVFELHGNIIENHCFDCKKPYTEEINLNDNSLPACKYCGGKIRPSVVWFGEMLPFEALKSAEITAGSCDVFFSIGTSAEVYPAANLPIQAKQSGAFVVEINPNKTTISPYMDICINVPFGEVMPAITKKLKDYGKADI